MRSICYCIIVVLVLVNYGEACDLIKFQHKTGKADFYEKLEGKNCNGEPIYKMLGDVFFMYKLPHGDFWCDSYTPSKLVICHAECDEIRFKVDDLYSPAGVTPEEYNGHFNEWIQVSEDNIMCNDVAEFEGVFVHDSPTSVSQIGQIQEKLETIQSEIKDERNISSIHEKEIDSLMVKIKAIQNAGLMTTTEAAMTSLSDEDKYILSMMNILPSIEKQRMEKIQSQIVNATEASRVVTASRFITNTQSSTLELLSTSTTSTTTTTMAPTTSPKKFLNTKNSIKKVDIFNNRDNTCSRIELQIIDDQSMREATLIYDVLSGKTCLNYPVYRSEHMYIFRNAFGEWCQKEIDDFNESLECFRKCKSILLGPGKIRSPIETTKVTVFAVDSDEIYAEFTNHRYVCTAFSTCDASTCKNGGECVAFNGGYGSSFKCMCPYYSTGKFCEQIIDTCHSNPCQNEGICNSKPFQNFTCECPAGFAGELCQVTKIECKTSNCQNGGKCYTQTEGEYKHECVCSSEYKGLYCELPALDDCKGQGFGQNIPHPTETTKFLTCLQDGFYRTNPCPVGLVFNGFKGVCDYSASGEVKSETSLKPCDIDQPNPCLNQGVCIPKWNWELPSDYICECKSGFNGTHCESNIDDCAENDCGWNAECVDLINTHVCLCNDGRYGKNCASENVKIPCGAITEGVSHYSYPFDPTVIVECDNNGKLMLKTCAHSLHWNPTKASCVYPNESPIATMSLGDQMKCLNKACQNHGKCYIDEDDNSAKCRCEPGYEGDMCEVNIDECASNPCLNNGKCVDGVNSYYCVCENKFIDKDCCCVDAQNPCENVLLEFQSKRDKTVRYPHPFTKEKFVVCNLEGFAQVLDCPEGLIWKQDEETCAKKNDNINTIYEKICGIGRENFKLTYPYSGLKYAICLAKDYELRDCPVEVPYFCERTSECVEDYNKMCKKPTRMNNRY